MTPILKRLAQLEKRRPDASWPEELTVVFIEPGTMAETGRVTFRPGART